MEKDKIDACFSNSNPIIIGLFALSLFYMAFTTVAFISSMLLMHKNFNDEQPTQKPLFSYVYIVFLVGQKLYNWHAVLLKLYYLHVNMYGKKFRSSTQ